jgi:hypothetical protein
MFCLYSSRNLYLSICKEVGWSAFFTEIHPPKGISIIFMLQKKDKKKKERKKRNAPMTRNFGQEALDWEQVGELLERR